jgi:hypothetical protein
MADQKCPSCGADLPPEVGQHALAPSAGIVECPTCGATVTLERPGTETESDGDVVGESSSPETFSGHETVEGVREELSEKEEG